MNKIDQAYDHVDYDTTTSEVWWQVRDGAALVEAYWVLRDEIMESVRDDPSFRQTTTSSMSKKGVRSMRMRVRGIVLIALGDGPVDP